MIRVLIVDDHPIVRRGIQQFLETEADIEVVGHADNGRQAVAECARLAPDLVLMDLMMPEMNGIEASRAIKEAQPEVQILVLTSFASDDQVFPAIKAGATGYLMKDTHPNELLTAIRQVHRGETTLHPTIAQKLLRELAFVSAKAEQVDPLTDREVDVLKLLARGMSNSEIAAELVVSVATVYTHVSRILDKLHLGNRTQAALYALREGLASLYEDEGD